MKIAYLFIEETSLSINGEGRAALTSIIISGPLVMRELPKVPCGLRLLGRFVE
jgi:hypothetical protein